MSESFLINDPPIHDMLVHPSGKASPEMREWLSHLQDSVNLFMGIMRAGSYHTVAGVTQTINVTGVKAGDYAYVVVATAGATPRTIVSQATANNQIIVTMSGDPGTDHILNWLTIKSS